MFHRTVLITVLITAEIWLLPTGAVWRSRGRSGLPVLNSPYGLCGRKATLNYLRVQEPCESRGGRPGLPVHNSLYGLYGRKATLNYLRAQELCGSRGGRPGLPVPNSPPPPPPNPLNRSLIVLMVSVDVKQH